MLPNSMKREDIQITSGLSGLQSGTVDHKCGACEREVSLVVVAQHTDCQIPFMLHGLWKTIGTELKLDETDTADVYVISDFV